jgi:thioredoxin reductase/Fe-S-cluster-containing dehydrogenase component/CRP-like cAMP-binding protein
MQKLTGQDPGYRIAIIGAGPAGLSAAGRAARLDAETGAASPTHILIEGFAAHAKTVQRYQKGKHVMAEPGFLDLRSDMHFEAGARENILGQWQDDLKATGANIRLGTEVKSLSGSKGSFAITLADGTSLVAEHIVLAIGLEGNPRKLGVAGEDLPRVQYQLDDPKEYADETILVVGAGDAAIENALALAAQNDVWILNRRDEFSRAKEGNLNGILAAISNSGSRLGCYYSTAIKSVVQTDGAEHAMMATLETPEGELEVPCDRIIARLGAIPPRKFVESTGVKFPSDKRDAIPELTRHYESNVPGIYIIGSLAGYPLIKQAMNQGYDVVEFINGNFIQPADHPLLEYQFHGLPYDREVDDLIERFQSLIPMFGELNALAFRELVIESNIIVSYPSGPEYAEAEKKAQRLAAKFANQPKPPRTTLVIREGDVIYEAGEFGTSFYTIVDGEVFLERDSGDGIDRTELSRGEFFGEMSLLSGRPRLERAIAGPSCIVVESPRRTMVKLMNSNDTVREGIEWIFIVRELQAQFAPHANVADLRDISSRVQVCSFKAGETIFSEGEQGACLHIIRSGGVALSRNIGGTEVLVSEVRGGGRIGDMALMGDPTRRETARATVAVETIEVRRQEFIDLVRKDEKQIKVLQATVSRHVTDKARMAVRPESGTVMKFLMAEGLGEATNVLVIDETLCVGCDNCEKACAETHGGISRLKRREGPSLAEVHIPVACRHCEQPHCMKDCPPNASRRAETGEVYINDSCIGCGNCVTNCPYDVISLNYDAPEKPGLLSWLLFGAGSGPGQEENYAVTDAAKKKGKKATKCDACVGQKGGPACVAACPTGAAMRIGPAQFIDLVEERRR